MLASRSSAPARSPSASTTSNGEYYALEDRCSHDDGPLCEGDFDCEDGVAICPRHGANIDIRSGRALHPAGRRSRSRRIPCASTTGWSRSTRVTEPATLLADDRSAVQRLPRRGMGTTRARRAWPARAPVPRGLPVRALLADDPPQARELPRRLRGLRRGRRRAVRRARTSKRLLGDAGIDPPPRQDRGGDRQRARDARTARSGHAAARRSSGSTGRRGAATPRGPKDWRASTPESTALSKRLKAAGFRFVGPTTVYAAMQECGVVNDHLADCFVRGDVEREIAYSGRLMLDDRVRAVLAASRARGRGGARAGRCRQPFARARSSGRPVSSSSPSSPRSWDCEVLEVGGSRGYSTIWLAAGVRHLGGRVLSSRTTR